MAAVVAALDPLSPEARSRVLRYVADMLGVALPMGAPELDEAQLMERAAQWASSVLDMLDPLELRKRSLEGLGLGDDPDVSKPLFENIKQSWRFVAGTEEAAGLWHST